MTKTLVLMVCCTCMLGGCTIQEVCPPIRGTVVDAVTGVPVKSAKVTIGYWNPERVSQTDSQGRFSFGAKHEWVPVTVTYNLWPRGELGTRGFSVQAEADGCSASDSTHYGWRLWGPDLGKTAAMPPRSPGAPKMAYDGEAIVIDPIALARAPAKAPTN